MDGSRHTVPGCRPARRRGEYRTRCRHCHSGRLPSGICNGLLSFLLRVARICNWGGPSVWPRAATARCTGPEMMLSRFLSLPFAATVALLGGTVVLTAITARRVPGVLAVPLDQVDTHIAGWT